MAGRAWTAAEKLDAALLAWPEFHQRYPERTFDAWEVKRRREGKPAVAEALYEPREKIKVDRAKHCVTFNTGFYDIETTMGRHKRILMAAVVNQHGEYQLKDYYTDPGKAWWDDEPLLRAIIEMLRPFELLIGWNSKRFDLKVINGRAARHGIAPLRPQLHLDLMNVYRFSMDVGGSSLENISEVFESEYHKIRVNPTMHERAEAGDKEAYDLLREHNVADVLLTRDVFPHALPFITNLTKSPLF